jgi:hypothetical protein
MGFRGHGTTATPPASGEGRTLGRRADALVLYGATGENDSSANTVAIKTSDGSTIDGVAGTTRRAISAQYGKLVLVSDGNNWWNIV